MTPPRSSCRARTIGHNCLAATILLLSGLVVWSHPMLATALSTGPSPSQSRHARFHATTTTNRAAIRPVGTDSFRAIGTATTVITTTVLHFEPDDATLAEFQKDDDELDEEDNDQEEEDSESKKLEYMATFVANRVGRLWMQKQIRQYTTTTTTNQQPQPQQQQPATMVESPPPPPPPPPSSSDEEQKAKATQSSAGEKSTEVTSKESVCTTDDTAAAVSIETEPQKVVSTDDTLYDPDSDAEPPKTLTPATVASESVAATSSATTTEEEEEEAETTAATTTAAATTATTTTTTALELDETPTGNFVTIIPDIPSEIRLDLGKELEVTQSRIAPLSSGGATS